MSMQNAKFKHKEHLYITIKLFSFKQLLHEVTCSKDESLKFMKQQHILLSSVLDHALMESGQDLVERIWN